MEDETHSIPRANVISLIAKTSSAADSAHSSHQLSDEHHFTIHALLNSASDHVTKSDEHAKFGRVQDAHGSLMTANNHANAAANHLATGIKPKLRFT